MQSRPACEIGTVPRQLPSRQNHPGSPPPSYEEVIVRPPVLARCPLDPNNMPEHEDPYDNPEMDQEYLPPAGVLQYEHNVGEWIVYPTFPPPSSALFHRRLQQRLAAEVDAARKMQQMGEQLQDPVIEEDREDNMDMNISTPASDLQAAVRLPLRPLAIVDPLQPVTIDLRAIEELPETSSSDNTLPPSGPNNTFIMGPVESAEDLYVTADTGSTVEPSQPVPMTDGAATVEPAPLDPPADGATALEPVCTNIFYDIIFLRLSQRVCLLV